MAFNIDMEKTFDKMEWNFLLAILHKLGLHPIWINWIRLCISTSSFSVLLNSSPFGLFSPSRGLRQVICSHLFYSLLEQKLFPTCFIVVFVISK
jgi:hypothetical protein